MSRPKSEFLKGFGKAWEVLRVIVNVVLDMGGNDDDLAALLTDKKKVRRIGAIIVEKAAAAAEYFTPVSDAEVPPRHKDTLAKYRRLATEWGVSVMTAVCYRVRAGFTIRDHAALFGPCQEGFQYLKDWNFPDEPTKDCLVFWIPRLVPDSTNKSYSDQITLLVNIRTRLELPVHHMANLGKVALDSGLILAHHKATGERVPLNCLWIRTDTCLADGNRLSLGFDERGLLCSYWFSDEAPLNFLGVFALGVEDLGD